METGSYGRNRSAVNEPFDKLRAGPPTGLAFIIPERFCGIADLLVARIS
jgi:hypothetical protein